MRLTTQILTLPRDRLAWEATMTQIKGHSIYYEQDLSADNYVKLMKRFGDCEAPGQFMNPKKNPEIFIVTAKKDKHGKKLGMFGETELGWHSNGNSRHNVSHILIALYCVEEDVNTTLSICNTARPFQDLTEDQQAAIFATNDTKFSFTMDTHTINKVKNLFGLDKDETFSVKANGTGVSVSGKSFSAAINPESNGSGAVTVYKKYLNLLDKEAQNVHISDSKIVFESTESSTLLTVSTCQTA